MDYLKSTNFTSLLDAVGDVDSPASSELFLVTTGDVPMDDMAADESEVRPTRS